MNDDLKGALALLFLIAGITIVVMLVLSVYGCAAAGPAYEAAYTAELLQCVDEAGTKEASRECRKAVDAKWHVDGGAK